MTIVPASMHHTLALAGIGQARRLLDRQRVHVCTQAEATGAGPDFQRADHASFRQAPMHLVTPRMKTFRDKIAGLVLLEREFRMSMNAMSLGFMFFAHIVNASYHICYGFFLGIGG